MNECQLDFELGFLKLLKQNLETPGYFLALSSSILYCMTVRIITGCTVSVIFFTLAMNMLTRSVEMECRGPLTRSGVQQPPIRALVDDLTVATTLVLGCR